jgi:Flp pilus assembly pilin Flp
LRSSPRPALRLREDERGQGLIEYTLILLLVVVVVTGALGALGVDITGLFESVAGFD